MNPRLTSLMITLRNYKQESYQVKVNKENHFILKDSSFQLLASYNSKHQDEIVLVFHKENSSLPEKAEKLVLKFCFEPGKTSTLTVEENNFGFLNITPQLISDDKGTLPIKILALEILLHFCCSPINYFG